MSWCDILAACGVWLAVACVSLAAAVREHVLPLFIDSNCSISAQDTDSTSTEEEHDSTLDDADAARDPYTERLPHSAHARPLSNVSRRVYKQKSKATPDDLNPER
jgi:hypothetical protein